MAFLTRKISRAKWQDDSGQGRIYADAVTSDLKTTQNTLSFWRFDEGTDEAKMYGETALAIVAGWQDIDKIDLVWLQESVLEDDNVCLKSTAGQTPVLDLVQHHLDAVDIDIEALGRVARRLASQIRNSGHVRRMSISEVKRLLQNAVDSGRVAIDSLSPKVREKLRPP